MPIQRRNTAARSPLMRKGGPHIKSKTGQRLRSRLSMQDAIDDWQGELDDATSNHDKENNGEQVLPELFLRLHTIEVHHVNR